MSKLHSRESQFRSGNHIRTAAAIGALAVSLSFGSVPVMAAEAPAPECQAESLVIYNPEDSSVIPPVGVTPTTKGWMWSNGDGTYAKGWITPDYTRWYYANGDGILQTGFVTFDGLLFYLRDDGSVQRGWNTTPEGQHFYIRPDNAQVATNTVVDGYTIGADGIAVIPEGQVFTDPSQAGGYQGQVTDPAFYQKVQGIIASVTTPEMSQEQKLRACYDYVIDHTGYKRTYETPSGDWTKGYATEVYDTGLGNCYRYAAALAYLARGLGYDCHVVTGKIAAARGGVTPHAWVEVNVDGSWMILDCEMADAKKNSNGYYMRSYANYPVKPLRAEQTWEISF